MSELKQNVLVTLKVHGQGEKKECTNLIDQGQGTHTKAHNP